MQTQDITPKNQWKDSNEKSVGAVSLNWEGDVNFPSVRNVSYAMYSSLCRIHRQ